MDEQPPQPPPPTPPPLVGNRPPMAPPPPIISHPAPAHKGGSVVWKILTFLFLGLLVLSLLSHAFVSSHSVASRPRTVNDRNRNFEEIVLRQTNGDNKIAVVTVSGVISGRHQDQSSLTMPEYINEQLKTAAQDSDVKAVILKVDSPGGEVLASDEINRDIRQFQEDTHKPVIASMGTLAASGGYYISVPCRWIVANELTITGSIGVIMDTWNYRQLMDKVGILPHAFKSGRFKDMLSGEREPDTSKLPPQEQKNREEEDKMVQALIDETFGKFKEVVRTGRSTAADENKGEGHALAADWQDYADGRVLSGRHAMDLGFVDELGDFDAAVRRAEKLTGINSASLVEYRETFDFQSVVSHLFGKTETPALKIDLGMDAPRLEAGQMYYMLPTAVLH